MVPEYSFFRAMSSCLIAMLPEGFYSRVEEGSIVLKKSKTIRFSDQRGVLLDGEDEPTIEADLVIFATGFRGDQKLRDIFVSPWLQKIVVGPSNRTVPLYRCACMYLLFSFAVSTAVAIVCGNAPFGGAKKTQK